MAKNYKKLCRGCGVVISGSWSAGTDTPDEITYGVCDQCYAAQRQRDQDRRVLAEAARQQLRIEGPPPHAARSRPSDPRANRLVAVGLALLGGYSCYSANFRGDYEAAEGATAFEQPSRLSEECEDYSEGDNLDCVELEGECETKDEIDGRWAHIEVSSLFGDDKTCWIRYDDITFQHGVFASLWYATLGTPEDTRAINDRVQSSVLESIASDIHDLAAAGDFAQIVALEAKYSAYNLHYDESVLGSFDEAHQQIVYQDGIAEAAVLATTSPDSALKLIESLAKQEFPQLKPELEPLRATAETTRFEQDLEAVQDSDDHVAAAELLVRLSTQAYPADKLGLRAPTIGLLDQLEHAADNKKIKQEQAETLVSAATLLFGAPELIEAVAPDDQDRRALTARITALVVAGQTIVYIRGVDQAKRLSAKQPESAAKLICQIREREIPASKPELDDLDAKVQERLASIIKKRSTAYVAAISGRKHKTWRKFETEYLAADNVSLDEFEESKTKWLQDNPGLDPKRTKAKVGEISISDCGSKALVTLEPRAPQTGTASFQMCFHDDDRKWLPCGPLVLH